MYRAQNSCFEKIKGQNIFFLFSFLLLCQQHLPKFFLSSRILHRPHILSDQTNLEINGADNRSLASQKSLIDERNVNRLKIPRDGFHIVPDG